MAEPFEVRASKNEGLLSKVANRVTRGSAARGIETLLAEAECVRDVSAETMRGLCEQHGVDPEVQLRTLRRNLYRRFLEHCLLDFALSESEVDDLGHLRTLLHLDDADVAHIQDLVARQVYGAAVEDVLQDHRLDDEERRFLRTLREQLDIPEYQASRMVEEERLRSQERLLSRTVIDSSFLAPGGAVIELEGSSTQGVQAAVQAAVDHASEALPKLAWAELSQLKVRIESGRVVDWAVKLKAGFQGQEENNPGR